MADKARIINSALDTNNPQIISPFFDIVHLIETRSSCVSLQNEKMASKIAIKEWRTIFSYLLQSALSKDPISGLSNYSQAIFVFKSLYKSLENQFAVPILKTIAKSFYYFSINADYVESENQMKKLIPLALNFRGTAFDEPPILGVANQMMKLYFAKNDFRLANSMLQNISRSTATLSPEQYPISELASFYFNRGKVSVVFGDVEEAFNDLNNALKLTPLDQEMDRRLILSQLIPVNLARGVIPSHKLLQKYSFELYIGITQAIMDGNINGFDECLEANQLLYLRLGVWELIIKAKRMAELQLFRTVFELYNSTKIPIGAFHQSLCIFREYSIEETELLLANLISDKLIKANYAQAQGIIVFAKENAFPKLPINT